MHLSKFNILRIPIKLNKSLFCCGYAYYFQGKINTVAKRGAMLKDMVANKDKRKHWHLNLNLVSTKPKVRVFEKIHKPFRRKAVLNSLFITNITDVLSTGDVAPDLLNYGIEITGVSISQCMKILNVFWQVPPSNYDSCNDIGQILAIAAPKIRAELISRNVLGRVPHIHFLRDATNERISEYEKAAKIVESELKSEDTSIVADDSFTEKLYLFKEYRKSNVCKDKMLKVVEVVEEPKEPKEETPATPYKPIDMRNDACGLDHALLMDKVNAMRKRKKDPLQHTNVISPEALQSSDDLFSNIPGVCFQAGSSNEEESRDVILKQFRIGRKMLKEKYKDKSGDYQYYDVVEVDEKEFNSMANKDDFIDDEETPATPYKPIDMRNDACGLDHTLLMDKVNAMRKRKKDPLQHTNVISPEALQSSDDLFSNIPGVCFQAGSSNEEESRDVILKQFHIGRKMLKEKYKDKSGDYQYYDVVEVDEKEFNSMANKDDFIDDDETGDNTH